MALKILWFAVTERIGRVHIRVIRRLTGIGVGIIMHTTILVYDARTACICFWQCLVHMLLVIILVVVIVYLSTRVNGYYTYSCYHPYLFHKLLC